MQGPTHATTWQDLCALPVAVDGRTWEKPHGMTRILADESMAALLAVLTSRRFSPSKWRTPRLVELCSQAVGKAASALPYTSEVQAGASHTACAIAEVSKQMSSSRDTRRTYTCAASHVLWEDQDSCGTGSCQIPVCKSTIAPLVFIRIDQQNVERTSTSPCSD